MRRIVAKHYLCALSLVILALPHAGLCAGRISTMDERGERLAAGDWGGKHVHMKVTDGDALLEFDCAKGNITDPITLDAEGRFSAKGRFAREGFGPRVEDESPKGVPALYVGAVKGESLTLTVKLVETGEEVGTYTLTRGSSGRLWRCH